MDSELGCKAIGLSTSVLLGHGLPASETIDCLMQNINEQLNETNKQIEECVVSILEMSTSLEGGLTHYTDPSQALDHMAEKRLLEKSSCYDPEGEDISKLLRQVLLRLKNQPGCEEIVMQQLFELSSREGINLPVRASANDPVGVSAMSLNVAVDQSETINEELWTEISARLKKYFIEQLSQLPTMSSSGLNLFASKRLTYVQSLCSLYSRGDIWSKYRALRTQQFGALTLTHSNPSSHSIPFTKGVHHFETLVVKTQAMINEDFQLVNSGVFGNAVTTSNAIQEIYLDKLSDEVTAIVEGLENDLSRTPSQRGPKKNKDAGEFLKPRNELQRMGGGSGLRNSLRKQDSKSLDSLLSPSQEDMFTDLQWLPISTLGLQVRLVNCVMGLDAYLRTLQGVLTWQVTSQLQKPTRLRSALKSRKEPLLMKAFAGQRAAMFENEDASNDSTKAKSMMAELTSTFKLVEKESVESNSWEWKPVFCKVSSDMAKCIEQHVRQVVETMNQEENQHLEKHRCYAMARLPEELVGGRIDYPAKISQGVLNLFRELDLLLPLARAFSEGTTSIVRSVFMQCTTQVIQSLTIKYKQIGKEIPSAYPIKLWYQLLANQAFIRNQLYYYDVILGEPDKTPKPFHDLYKQMCEMTESTAEQLQDKHAHALISSVLQDADSNDWDNSKDFYEDERCGFPIQMFNLHMKALQAELWDNCPSKRAQSVYLSTLRRGLHLVAQRYSRIKPSYRRTKQVKFDIVAILLCTSELLLAGCSHVGGLLDPSASDTDLYSIHNSCCTLVAVMGVLSSPIETLYKVFKKGFGRKSRRGRDEDSVHPMYISQWLTCVLSDLYPFGILRQEDAQTTTALYLQLRMLDAQPEISYPLLLQSLLMKDYTLSIMMLTQVAQHCKSSMTRQDSSHDEIYGQESQQIFTDFVQMFMLLDNYPAALNRILLPVFERTNSWNSLDSRCVIGKDEQASPWIQSIVNCLEPFVLRVIEPGLSVVLARAETKPSVEPLINQLKELPCGCSPTHSHQKASNTKRVLHTEQENKDTDSDETNGFALSQDSISESKEVLAEAIYSIIMQITDDVYTLPTPLAILFRGMQDKLSSNNITAAHNCVAIQLIATAVRSILLDSDSLRTLISTEISQTTLETISMLAECTYHVLTALSYGKSSGIPRIASLFMKANKNWLSEQIEILADHFNNDVFDQPDTQPLMGHTPEYSIVQLTAASSHILSNAGNESLLNVYHLVQNNLPWIKAQLDIPPLLGKKQSPGHFNFTLDLSATDTLPFNPLKEYNRIGDSMFDMKEIRDLEINWASLLQSDLGLSEVGFKSLLFHRHEMQDGAQLVESEKKPVEALRKRFEADGAELV